ncbi:MAG: DUF86 domain-containing protein [Chloroflexi bacterium]|nr:DUF86 domain-containing protein [Chloroflexota bacterium]
MTRRDDAVSLRQMLHYAHRALVYPRSHSRQDLDPDDYGTMGLVKFLEVIGEAASRVSEPTRQQHSHIPWTQIVAFRNRVVHGYDNIDFDRVWQILTSELPVLVAALEQIIPSDES